MIHLLKVLTEKVDNMQEQIGNAHRDGNSEN